MMPDYSKIKDEHLRTLVMNSESIHSQPEAETQAIIDSIAALPPEAQKEVVANLEEEQKIIATTKEIQGITPEMEKAEIEKNSQQLATIKHEYDTSVRQIREEKTQGEDDKAAEDILNSLNNVP